jgi:hypothetical protein
MDVQSVIFDRQRFTDDAARAWLALHGFRALGKVHVTDRFRRFRQYDPKQHERYFTKALPNHSGVKLIIRITRPR